jgi:hypothetical protein
MAYEDDVARLRHGPVEDAALRFDSLVAALMSQVA